MVVSLKIQWLLIWMTTWLRCFCASDEILPSLSPELQNAVRSQRDLMFDVTIDQLPLVGVNLTSALFNEASESDSQSLVVFQSLLQNGVQAFTLDIEQRNNTWMLSQTNISFCNFLADTQSFINSTDDNLSANILVLLVRIFPGTNPGGNSTATMNSLTNNTIASSNMTYLLDQNMGRQRIYTPDDLQGDRSAGYTSNVTGAAYSGWPNLEYFLYTTRRRLLIVDLLDTLGSQVPYIFNSSVLYFDNGNRTLNSPNTTQDYTDLTEIAWRFLDSQFSSKDIRRYMNDGYSPIISNPYSTANISRIADILNTSIIWSWGNNQPLVPNGNKTIEKEELTAYNCAVLKYSASNSSAYWMVDNCYNEYEGLCRNSSYMYTWLITNSKKTYFEFDSTTGSSCPENYSFALPKTPLEQASLLIQLEELDSQAKSIWIDLNCIAIDNCWVTGGPYQTCPYQKSVSRRNFVAMITPGAVCSFVILIMVFYLNLQRIPIHNNRKSWKRIVTEVSQSEMEGVPS